MTKFPGVRIAFLLAALLTACGTGGGGANSGPMDILLISNGFGTLLPYRIHQGSIGGPVIEVRSVQDLIDNIDHANPDNNPVLPVASWPANAILPSLTAGPGNHFVFAEFTRVIKIESVLDPSAGGAVNFGLTGAITVVAVDPATGFSSPVPGRAFIDGITPDPTSAGSFADWVGASASGQPVALVPQAAGFPGVSEPFPGVEKLVTPNSFVFVVDSDGDLSTFETFPTGKQIKIRCSTGVKAKGGSDDFLILEAHASSTVGLDLIKPAVLLDPQGAPAIVPGNGMTGVSPLTDIVVEFTEPVQPGRVGPLPSEFPPSVSPSTQITFGPVATPVSVSFTAVPLSPYNLAKYRLTPAFNFPGMDPITGPGPFNTVNVAVFSGTVADLVYFGNPPAPVNLNTFAVATSFTTGEGPGIVNAPVSPDVIYVGRNGSQAGISVIDLNGFGQSTGCPVWDVNNQATLMIEWFWNQIDPSAPAGIPTTKFPYNPNIDYGFGLVPQIGVGTTTLDGGSGGVFSLTRDSALNDRVVRPPILSSVADMAIGQSLDRVINNSTAVCQIPNPPHGNICANSGYRIGGLAQNTVQLAPEPNPPRLMIPNAGPLCVFPLILGQEVTQRLQAAGITNVALQGDPFGDPPGGVKPTGYFYPQHNGAPGFTGPRDAAAAGGLPQNCITYNLRQQVGHFLYVVDVVQKKLLVLNSNRMTLIDTISPLPDPTRLAVEPNLKHLAVSNFGTDQVSFVDIDPVSNAFHQVVGTVSVGQGPLGIAWQPDNEDLFVCNSLGNSVTVISGASLTIRKTLASQVNHPIDVAITSRQNGFGWFSGVYYAYIMNQTGSVALFESGPAGSNGIGFDEVIGVSTETFPTPAAIHADTREFKSAVWIAHRTAAGQPAVSHLALTTAPLGILPLNPANQFGGIVAPVFRDKLWTVDRVVPVSQLTGPPTDISFDDARNVASAGQVLSNVVPTSLATSDSKQQYRIIGGGPVIVSFYTYMFLANPASGTVDVIDPDLLLRVDTVPDNLAFPATVGTQSIPAPGVSILCNYWRQ